MKRFNLIWRNGEYRVDAPRIGTMEVVEAEAFDTLRQENEDLKERIAEFESDLANAVDGGASCRMHERALRDKHYRECAEIARGLKLGTNPNDDPADRAYDQACEDIFFEISGSREEGK